MRSVSVITEALAVTVQHEYQRDPFFRAVRLFTLFAWRIRFGWMLVLFAGTALAAIAIGAFATLEVIPEIVLQILYYFLAGAWLSLGLLIAMFRRRLRGRAARWDQLTTAGKLARALITMLGTALLLAPFVWLGWMILTR